MEISWFGNSTFLFKTSTSKRILIDPFNILKTFSTDITADILTFSKSMNKYYNSSPNTTSKVIYSNKSYKDDSIKISSYRTFSDSVYGLQRGENFIHTYEIEALKLGHLGYLGHFPDDKIINILQNLDFLFIPIGGRLCLTGKDAYKLSNLINAKYIIPMCYKSSNSDFFFEGPLEFLSNYTNVYINSSNTIITTNLPSSNSILLLK